MKISQSEEWQIRILRAVLIGISSFMILNFFFGITNEILALSNGTSTLPTLNLIILSLFLGMLLAVSSTFSKVPVLRFERNVGKSKKKLSIEWKIRLVRATLITFVIFVSCLMMANALASILWITSGYSHSISAYEGGLFIWSIFLGLASILFEAPSELPSLGLKHLNPSEKAKVKKIVIFFLSVVVILNLLIYLTPSLISGYFPELAIETLIGMFIYTMILAMIITMGFVLLLTSKSTN